MRVLLFYWRLNGINMQQWCCVMLYVFARNIKAPVKRFLSARKIVGKFFGTTFITSSQRKLKSKCSFLLIFCK